MRVYRLQSYDAQWASSFTHPEPIQQLATITPEHFKKLMIAAGVWRLIQQDLALYGDLFQKVNHWWTVGKETFGFTSALRDQMIIINTKYYLTRFGAGVFKVWAGLIIAALGWELAEVMHSQEEHMLPDKDVYVFTYGPEMWWMLFSTWQPGGWPVFKMWRVFGGCIGAHNRTGVEGKDFKDTFAIGHLAANVVWRAGFYRTVTLRHFWAWYCGFAVHLTGTLYTLKQDDWLRLVKVMNYPLH